MIYIVPKSLQDYAQKLSHYYCGESPELADMAARCFLNTAETTIQPLADDKFFVITGDIPAMWLRDSTAQLRNYIPLAINDTEVQRLLRGCISVMMDNIHRDPYANAFNALPNGAGSKDETEQSPWVWERKYEIDSLCAPVSFAFDYWKATGDTEIFTSAFHDMLFTVLSVFRREQNHERSPYQFVRRNCPASDTLSYGGRGSPVGFTGMTWSGFRPSDDACEYGYLIPSNAFAVVALRKIAKIANDFFHDSQLANASRDLSSEIDEGIHRFGTVVLPDFGEIYAYETDGLSNYNLMDDANHPSLLSLPLIGYCSAQDPLYQRTRAFVLSQKNPYYYSGKAAVGIGSPHTPNEYVWPIALITQALTSMDAREIDECLHTLEATTAGTGWMHESFDCNHPDRFTRPWFAWANTLFAGLMIQLMDQGNLKK